jgi:membrane-bound ClpP family serine protease
MIFVIALIVVAILLAMGEILLPGGVLGILSFIAILGATWQAAVEFGPFVAVIVFFGSTTLTILSVFFFFQASRKMGLSRGMFLSSRVDGHSGTPNPTELPDDIIGHSAETLTPMVPTGMILIDGKSYEAFSQSGFLEKGEPCKVIGKDNFRLIVKSEK